MMNTVGILVVHGPIVSSTRMVTLHHSVLSLCVLSLRGLSSQANYMFRCTVCC